MNKNQQNAPLFETLKVFSDRKPISFHVPGHKNGDIFPEEASPYFASILSLDLTELRGLDDLHAPKGAILEAQQLAAAYFGADATFFLVGGSTVGNLAMLLSTCTAGDKVIVQRNSHKSIFNGLELSGARPIFIAPRFDETVQRYTEPDMETLEKALHAHPDAKAVVLTYPDYFGRTYDIKAMIDLAHAYHIPVLVDEAHGVHFSLGAPFPPSALQLGADIVVQSAHKMAPAMTMASFLHIKSKWIKKEQIAYYLQMLESSSPSYPLMASLDLARKHLANMERKQIGEILESCAAVKEIFQAQPEWSMLPGDDPLKWTIQLKPGYSGFEAAELFEAEHIYPELAAENQILFIHGLGNFQSFDRLEKAVKRVAGRLKIHPNHATIKMDRLFTEPVKELALSHAEMRHAYVEQLPWQEGAGYIAAEAIIPYPPGIPLVLKGERMTAGQIAMICQLVDYGATFQHRDLSKGINVFTQHN